MEKGYSYDSAKISEYGKDRMRFELGDIMVEGGADTAALTDEEIETVVAACPNKWKRAKLMLLESLYRRFSYEVDTRTGPLTLSLQSRAKLWKEEYEALKKEVALESCSVPKFGGVTDGKQPYFFSGMQKNERTVRE